MITITIDGKKVEVPEGTTVLRAAQANGFEIPTLCDHPNLTPYGGCRLCLVEVEGARTLQPSCTLPVSSNMVVHTDNERIRSARKFVLTMIFSERNHFCPFCQVSGGDCELQNAAYGQEMTHWPIQPSWATYPVDASHPYFVLDHNRCILCRRCVRACGELVGNFTLGFEERGAKSFLVADLGAPLGESTCNSCGTCVQICPTGALIDRSSAYRGRETQVDRHPTICTGCSVGCTLDVLVRDNNMMRIEGDWTAELNGGVICKTGRFLPTVEDRTRIVTPMIRRDGKLVAATFEQALDAIAAEMKAQASKVAALASPRLSAETLHAFKQIFKDHLAAQTVTTTDESAATANLVKTAAALGRAFEGNLEDLHTADCFLLLDEDIVTDHEVAGFFIKRSLPLGASLVLVSEGAHPLDLNADANLKFKKGTLAAVIQGLRAALAQNQAGVSDAAAKTGIAADTFLQAAQKLSEAEKPAIVFGKNLVSQGEAQVQAVIALAEAAHAALLSTKGQANSLAAALFGLSAPLNLKDAKAVYVALGDEEPSHKLTQQLEKVPFLVVQAAYTSQLSAMAHVVLPAQTAFEQGGSYLNLDGRLQKSEAALQCTEEAFANLEILKSLAGRMGCTLDLAAWSAELHKAASPVALVP